MKSFQLLLNDELDQQLVDGMEEIGYISEILKVDQIYNQENLVIVH